MVPDLETVIRRPVTHYCYVVDDIERAVRQYSRAFGAGPFFLFERVEFELLEATDGPAVFDHATALGQWGPIAIEFQQMFDVQPPALHQRLVPPTPGIAHASYICADPAAESERLEALGLPQYLRARSGPFELTFHEIPGASHSIEIYQDNEFVHEFFAAMAAAAERWDGREPLRSGLPV